MSRSTYFGVSPQVFKCLCVPPARWPDDNREETHELIRHLLESLAQIKDFVKMKLITDVIFHFVYNTSMGCARGLGLGEQHVQDKSSLKWCYILSSGVARILVLGAFNLKNFILNSYFKFY